jgi:hypothetical protein
MVLMTNTKGNQTVHHYIPSAFGTRAVSSKEFKLYVQSVNKAANDLLGRRIVEKSSKVRIAKMPTDAMPKVKKAPKAGTKQARVNELVKAVLTDNDRKLDKAFKQEIIGEIMVLCEMTHAGATTYFYNAMKSL